MPDWGWAILMLVTNAAWFMFGRWTRRETVQLAQGMRVAARKPTGKIGKARTG